jgi:phosphoribosyl 1,2-cyclic phosphodiesterase
MLVAMIIFTVLFHMALFAASLNSGSNGNCYYVASNDAAILVDAGISCKETEKRMKRLGLSMKKVKAIFITHEHADHIFGVERLSKKYQLPVYITPITLLHAKLKVEEWLIRSFESRSSVQVDDLTIVPFKKIHDAVDAHSFVVTDGNVRIGIFTDIGLPDEIFTNHFSHCHAAFLESNYDEHMLENGTYPWALKNRIRGGQGHLSNKQALAVFLQHRPTYMSHLFLSHLSRQNNHPKKVKELFEPVAESTKIIVAPRDKSTGLYHIRSSMRLDQKPSVDGFQMQLFQ